MTNGDKIRNSSDEELLHYIGNDCKRCVFSVEEDDGLTDCLGLTNCLVCVASCTDGTLRWLKQEVEEEE